MKWILFLVIAGCATASEQIPPQAFEIRTYSICAELDGFCYRWRVAGKCTKKFLVWCQERELLFKEEKVPFDDKIGVKKFKDAGFELSKTEHL